MGLLCIAWPPHLGNIDLVLSKFDRKGTRGCKEEEGQVQCQATYTVWRMSYYSVKHGALNVSSWWRFQVSVWIWYEWNISYIHCGGMFRAKLIIIIADPHRQVPSLQRPWRGGPLSYRFRCYGGRCVLSGWPGEAGGRRRMRVPMLRRRALLTPSYREVRRRRSYLDEGEGERSGGGGDR